MAKLKDMRLGSSEALFGAAATELLKALQNLKYVGNDAAQALATAIGNKLDAKDVNYDEETGELTIKGIVIPHLEVPEDGEKDFVLTIVEEGDDDKKPVLGWKKIDVSESIAEALKPEGAIGKELAKYVNGAEYNEEGTDNDGKPCIDLKNGDKVIAHIPAEPFLKDSWVSSVEVVDGTGDNNGKKVLKFTYTTQNGTNPTALELPLEEVFKADNYFTKTEINNILYGDGGNASDVKGGIVKSINDLKTVVDGMVFSNEQSTTIDFTDAAGEKKTLVTSVEGLAKSGDVEKAINQAIYGNDTATAADGSIAKRLETLENINVTEITADDINDWIKAARVQAGLEQAVTD